MFGYRIRAAMGRGRFSFGRAVDGELKVAAEHRVSEPSIDKDARREARPGVRRGFAVASFLLFMLCCALPGRAFAACPTLSFTQVGQTLSIDLDPICDPNQEGLAPASGMPVPQTSFTVNGGHGSYHFTFTGFSGTTGDATYSVQLMGSNPSPDSVVVYVDSAGFGTSDTSVLLSVTTPAPTLTSVGPAQGSTFGGTTVNLIGSGLASATAVTFGGIAATNIAVVNQNTITVTTPAHSAGPVDVVITNPSGSATLTSGFTYLTPAPTVSSISPSSGPASGGTSVTLTGTNFTGATVVMFGSISAANFTVINATTITATAPAGTGTVDVTVSTTGGTSLTSAADHFIFVPAPTVSVVTPSAGPALGGTVVTLGGLNFSGATAVTFGGTAASGFTVNSATSISATVPAGTGTVDVRVTTPGGTSSTSASDQYTYVGAPTVSSISANAGPTTGGTSVTLTGANFTGATAVTFGGAAATFSVTSATSITATAPAGTGTVDIRVTTAGGTSATSGADQFTYVAVPTVTSISPTSGSSAGGTTVIISGSNFTGTTGVSFGGSNASSFTVTSASSITATSPSGSAGSTVDITVSSSSGTSATSASDHFTYVGAPSAPTLVAATAGDGQVSVNFTAPASNGGAAITNYTVTASPGGFIGTGASAPIIVTGLTNGTAYTFTVTASNGLSTGPASTPSNSVTPKAAQTISFNNPGAQNFGTSPTLVATSSSGLTVSLTSSSTGVCTITSGGVLSFLTSGTCTIAADQAGNGAYFAAPTVSQSFSVAAVVPGAPTIGTATAGDAQATVSFTAPASNGGGTITVYTVTANPGGATGTGAGSPVTVTGLTNGTPYTFSVAATNGTGSGSSSSQSNSVTPKATQTITFANPGSQNFGTSPTLVATATSALPVALTSATTNVCTVTPTGLLTTVSPGTCTINADQAGNNAFLAAGRVTQSFAIVVPGGALSITTTSLPPAMAASAYNQTITAVGGVSPYSFVLTSGALPSGLVLTPSGTLTGTPVGAGTFAFTVRVTDSATQTATQSYTLTITAPVISLTPTSLPAGQDGVAYSQQLSASGGTAGYSYSISAGSLPAGMSLSASGLLAGTPSAAGNFNFTVTAKDSLNFTGSQAFTLALHQPAPVAVNDSASTAANASSTIAVTGNDSGPITSIAIAQAPAHGTATVSGLNVVYTPSNNYYGTDSFTYTDTGPGGTSAPATVSLTVTPLAVPVAQPLTTTVLAGKAVTLHAAQGATGGPFTALNVATPPSTGTLVISGTDLVYTPTLEASGVVSFDYTLSNAFGTSLPAHVTITVNPMPLAPTLSATVLAGSSVQVDLTSLAHGGPFTGAAVVSVSPTNAGTASVHATDNGYALTFNAAATFSGTAQLSYTLSNAYATSTPGNISVSVTARPDPSKDAEVVGILDAQVESTRRLAQGQINNFQQRLQSLHQGGGDGGFSNGITLTSPNAENRNPMLALRNNGDNDEWARRYIVQPDDVSGGPAGSPASASTGSLPGGITVWTGGALNFGKTQPGSSDNGIDFTTSGVSVGADKRISDALALGAGLGYGHDASDVGQHGSRSTTDSYNVALYSSYRPANNVYLDGLLGYQWLSFDARRYVTGDGSIASASRAGTQLFGSLALGYEHRTQDWLLSPYARLDLAHARLDGYTEQALATDALSYDRQTVKTTTGNLGLRAEWTVKADYGLWQPSVRAEYEHDFQGAGVVTMRYADLLSGPLYQASLAGQSSNRTLLGAGIQLQTLRGWMLRFEYQNILESSARDNQSLLFGVEKKFNP